MGFMRNKIFSWYRLNKLLCDKKGVTAIEYALIASLVSISIIASLNVLGISLTEKYDCIDSEVSGALSGSGSGSISGSC
jgi:Flp pilus assembly pilin Flp